VSDTLEVCRHIPTPPINHFGYLCPMRWLRNFYQEYKPYVFSDGWYYIFIIVFIILLFVFFS
jgi:hypothetical protein